MSQVIRGATARAKNFGAGEWLIAATCGVILLRVVRVIFGSYIANGDIAVIELRVRDVPFPGVEIGPFSRFGWSHPGPLLYWLFAPLYRLLGESSASLPIVAGVVNIGCVVGTAATIKKTIGRSSVVTPILLMVFVAALGNGIWVSPWNPDIPLLPFSLLVTLLWATACGLRTPLWLLVLLGSFLAQSHVGFALPLVVLGLSALSFRVMVREPVSQRKPFRRGDAALATVVGLVVWAPPLVEQFREGSDGNIAKMFEFFTGNHDPRGTLFGLRMVSNELGLFGSWWRGMGEIHIFTGDVVRAHEYAIPVVLAVLIAIAVIAIRDRDQVVQAGLVLSAALAFSAVVAVGSIDGYLYDYLVRWVGVVGWWSTTIIAIALVRWFGRNFETIDTPQFPRALLHRCALIATVIVGVVVLGPATYRGITDPVNADTFDSLVPDISERLIEYAGSSTPLVIIGAGSLEADLISTGLVLDLEKHGVAASVTPEEGYIVGKHRAQASDDSYLLVVNAGRWGAAIPAVDDATEIIRIDDLTKQERAECDEWNALVTQHVLAGEPLEGEAATKAPKCGLVVVVSRQNATD